MSKFNVNTVGRLTRDPELKYTANGTALASFGVATDKSYKKGEEWIKQVVFSDWEAWNKQAETAARNLKKGMKVRLEGEYTPNNWETKEGEKRLSPRFRLYEVWVPLADAETVTETNTAAVETVAVEEDEDTIPF